MEISINQLEIKPNHLFLFLVCLFLIFSNVSITTSILVLFSSLFFYVSFEVGERLGKLNIKNEKQFIVKPRISSYKFGVFLMLIGIIFTIFDLIWVRGIPLFEPASRRFLNVQFTMLSHLLPLGWAIVVSSSKLNETFKNIPSKCNEISKVRNFCKFELSLSSNSTINTKRIIIYSLIFSMFIGLLGYRTQVIVLLLATAFSIYYSNRIKTRDVLLLFLLIFLVLISLSVFRLYVLGVEGNPIISRIDLTMSILDILIQNYAGYFNGVIHTSIFSSWKLIPGPSSGPRTIIANSIGVGGVTITPTIFGAVVMDYGILGLIPYFGTLGMVMGFCYGVAKRVKGVCLGFYSIMVAYLLVGIETGILDFEVVLFYVVGFLLCLKESLKRFNIKKGFGLS
jgi:uncharacterized membrane protein